MNGLHTEAGNNKESQFSWKRGQSKMISRRQFAMLMAGAIAAGKYCPQLFAMGNDDLAIPGKDRMIVRSLRFLDLEMPLEYATSYITPVEHFFVRNHMHEPSTLDPAEWRLTITGEVENTLTLDFATLGKLETHSVTNTLECAGNGRGLQNPPVPGIQWQKGAVGNARFTGPRLGDLLQRAGVKPTGKHVAFRGLDEVPGKTPQFIRSIPLEKATDKDTLIATRMNGTALTRHHGFPARALVPGWIGSASVKWLTEIKVLDKEFEGNFMKPGYRWPDKLGKPGEPVNPDETHPLTSLAVKSLIASPLEGSIIKLRENEIRGVAWAGEADIVRVEVSTDSGRTWQAARLGKQQERYAWRLWSLPWKPARAGQFVIMSRATDNGGRSQPAKAEWNPSGYLYNAIDQVKIHVQA
jgi:sulfite oxidase